ncbi:MAG TPA: hypothetical protein VFX59_19765 [Polyangiales bacterium]|nr:hypothetical protein [Polyangiales bacterium]
MPTQTLISSHQHRSRTRSTAFLLAVSLFAAVKLISAGAVNVSHAHDVEGLQMLEADCGSEQALHC